MRNDLTATDRPPEAIDGTGRSIALVCSRFNDSIVERLEHGARRALIAHDVNEADIDTHWVPGALEIPQVASALAASGRYDAIVALGCVIKGDTYHFEIVCDQSAAGLMQLSIATDVVVINGIITAYDAEQARGRSADDDNRGAEVALAALKTVAALDRIADG